MAQVFFRWASPGPRSVFDSETDGAASAKAGNLSDPEKIHFVTMASLGLG